MGFELLLNENRLIKKDEENICVIGLENWGKGGFKKAGDLEKARTYVNMVRERAANSDTWVKLDDDSDAANYSISLYEDAWTSQADARAAVRFERKLELAMEGQRFYDLVRWGVAEEVLDAYISHENGILPTSPFVGADFTTNQDEYLPIPQDEIDLLGSDVLIQNDGY